jgi:hypothetical protein
VDEEVRCTVAALKVSPWAPHCSLLNERPDAVGPIAAVAVPKPDVIYTVLEISER